VKKNSNSDILILIQLNQLIRNLLTRKFMIDDHFKGKTAVKHVVEAQARGIIAAAEIHGTEIPGSISSATDAARNTTILLLLCYFVLAYRDLSHSRILVSLMILAFGWLIWMAGRSAWLGWSRLERLHRILEEERWEIEHNREQERDELKALYQAKGFEGKLLEDVMDVLMADGDRLLKVMIEEELGLTLEVDEHPLKQSVGALIGTTLAASISLFCYWIWPLGGIYLATGIVITVSSWISAYYQGNRQISTVVWNSGLTFLAASSTYFLLIFFHDMGLIK